MYKNHRQTKNIEEAHFVVLGPPSSAFPNNGRNRLAMMSVMPSIAQTVYTITLNAKVPALTSNPPSVP